MEKLPIILMLTANRIKQLQDEIDELKRKSANSKNTIKKLFIDNYSIDMSKYDEEVISTDYINITDEVDDYRPDEELEIILEMRTKYIHISYQLIHRHSDIETRVSITEDKNITTDMYDIFNEVYLDDLEKYNLTDFEKNLITAIINEPVEDPTFISYLGSDEDSSEGSDGESGAKSDGESAEESEEESGEDNE